MLPQGSRKTNQKKLMEEEARKLRSFFDAEKLYRQVSKRNKKIGIATIYRFLKKLVEQGEFHSYSCGGKTIYSSNAKSHCHFICEICKSVKHFDLRKLDFIRNDIKGDICHFQMSVTGICEKCKNNKHIDK